MIQGLSLPIESHYTFYPDQSDGVRVTLDYQEKKFRNESPDWRRWSLYKAWVDKHGILQTGASTNFPSESSSPFESLERVIRMDIRKRLNTSLDIENLRNNDEYFPRLSRKRMREILNEEIEKETPMIRPVAYRMHFPGQKNQYVDYILAELPNPNEGQEYGDFYLVDKNTQTWMMVSTTGFQEKDEIASKNHMVVLPEDFPAVKITELWNRAKEMT